MLDMILWFLAGIGFTVVFTYSYDTMEGKMITREQQIENYAITSTASWLERVTPIEGLPSDARIDSYFDEACASAEIAIEACDRCRSSRSTSARDPRTEALELFSEISEPIDDDDRIHYVTVQIGREAWERIKALRDAFLKAQQIKEVSDGAREIR